MLLPYTTLTYHGPAACAMVVDALGSVQAMQPRGTASVGAAAQGIGEIHFMRLIRLRGFPMSADGLGELHAMQPRMRARIGLDVKIGTLTQDDVEGAVLESVIEGDITLKQAIRLLLAQAAGNASGLDSTPVFKSMDGSKTRLSGTVSSGTRTILTRDGS